MDLLKDFAQKDMIEQIICLDEIKESRLVEAIPGLWNLYANPLGDQAVDEMVYHTIFDLLAGREQVTIADVRKHAELHAQELPKQAKIPQAKVERPSGQSALSSVLDKRNSTEEIKGAVHA